MSYSIRTIPPFEKQFKRLYKKFPSLKSDIAILITQLQSNPELGTALGHDCYKIRLAITSKGKGKSAGARIITCIVTKKAEAYLLYIYDKSDQSNITDKELLQLLDYL